MSDDLVLTDRSEPKLRSVIFGPGALGALTACHIQRYSEVRVHPHKKELSLAGKLISFSEKIEYSLNWQAPKSPNPDIDIVWLCAKVFHVSAYLSELVDAYPKAVFVHLHNGMGPQQLGAKLAPDRVLWGSTTVGALRKGDKVIHTGKGVTHIGPPGAASARQQCVLGLIQQWPGPMNFQINHDINTALWNKLAINAVINPITAFHQIANGELLSNKYRSEIETLCRELKAIARAEGVALRRVLFEEVMNVAKKTANNRSSMAEDVRLKRKTEIEQINGFILEKAKRHGLDLPQIEAWYARIACAH